MDAQDIEAAVDTRHWAVLDGRLQASFETGSFARGVAFVTAVGRAAEELNHHPDVDLRYPAVTFRLLSHDVGELTDRDMALALRISALAGDLSIGPAAAPQQLTIAIDAMAFERVVPFWQAGLGYDRASDVGDEVRLVDPADVGPPVWFQPMDEPRPQRNRVHLDVYVPRERARARVDAVLAAGGVLVTDEFAPAWWVLADPEGNELCVCTDQQPA